MMKRIYIMITITLILLIINICLSLYINSHEYYDNNYLSHYYKLKNMPTIIPFYFDEPNYEFEYIDDNIYTYNMNEKEGFTNHDKNNNNSNNELDYCYSLLNKFINCLSGNPNNHKCERLFNEKLNELEKCEIINANYSVENMRNNIVYFNLPNNNLNTDIENEFEKEKKFNEIKVSSNDENQIKKYEFIPEKINQFALPSPNRDEIEEYNNKDCVEYGLIDEHIICTKYE
jgi:hypothetical protein